MISRLYPNDAAVALALRIVDLLTTEGVSVDEAKAVLALAWLDIQYQAWETRPISH